jgi:hypothetical protein
MTEFLAAHPEIEHQSHEAVIPIRIEFRSLDEVVVSIPEWAVKKTDPEF